MLQFKGNNWLDVSNELPPYNGPECLHRWLKLNPEAKYPYEMEMDTCWKVKKVVSMRNEGRSWGEIAKVIPWDQTKFRKFWFSHYWGTFIYWFPNGRNFQDRPQFWRHKVCGQPCNYEPQGQNMENTAEPRAEGRAGERERRREAEYVEKMDEGQVEDQADHNGHESLGDGAELSDEDAEGETDNEHVVEVCKGRNRKEGIDGGADSSGKEERPKDNGTRPKDKTVFEDATTSEEDAKMIREILDVGEARWVLEQADDEDNGMLRAGHAFEL